MYCKIVLAVLVSCCILQAMSETNIDSDIMSIDTTNDQQVLAKFNEFKTQFDRHYTVEEEPRRFEIFRENLAEIQRMNQEEQGTATFGINKFADKTKEEMTHYTGLRT